MKIVLQDNRRYVLRFDKGEEVMDGIRKFMRDQKISACVFEGIGSCSEAEIGYYNQHLKSYRQKPFQEDLEVVSLNGNGAMAEDEPLVHAHGMFGRTDFSVFGGHVFKLLVSATCEIFLIRLEGHMKRTLSPDWNLKLLE